MSHVIASTRVSRYASRHTHTGLTLRQTHTVSRHRTDLTLLCPSHTSHVTADTHTHRSHVTGQTPLPCTSHTSHGTPVHRCCSCMSSASSAMPVHACSSHTASVHGSRHMPGQASMLHATLAHMQVPQVLCRARTSKARS